MVVCNDPVSTLENMVACDDVTGCDLSRQLCVSSRAELGGQSSNLVQVVVVSVHVLLSGGMFGGCMVEIE